MSENSFEEKIKELRNGSIDEIIVESNEFLAFREVWKELSDRVNIVGEAGLNGRIIYRYLKTEERSEE